MKTERSQRIIKWLRSQAERLEIEIIGAEGEMAEYIEALEQYKTKGSLPRGIRQEIKTMGIL